MEKKTFVGYVVEKYNTPDEVKKTKQRYQEALNTELAEELKQMMEEYINTANENGYWSFSQACKTYMDAKYHKQMFENTSKTGAKFRVVKAFINKNDLTDYSVIPW